MSFHFRTPERKISPGRWSGAACYAWSLHANIAKYTLVHERKLEWIQHFHHLGSRNLSFPNSTSFVYVYITFSVTSFPFHPFNSAYNSAIPASISQLFELWSGSHTAWTPFHFRAPINIQCGQLKGESRSFIRFPCSLQTLRGLHANSVIRKCKQFYGRSLAVNAVKPIYSTDDADNLSQTHRICNREY